MSVLVYHDRHTASVAAATLVASALLKDPACTLGVDWDPSLDGVYETLSAMTKDGLLNWGSVRVYQMSEFVPSEARDLSIADRLGKQLFAETAIRADRYFVPISDGGDWATICSAFDARILADGGLDTLLLAVRQDGSLLYNPVGSDPAPITHVELFEGDKIVTAGVNTIMQSKRLIVLLLGDACKEAAERILKGAVSSVIPASLLQLHGDATFILDEEAAEML